MKKFKTCLLPVCISALLLCGCSQTENTETATAAETVLSAEESADITEASADITEVSEDITDETAIVSEEVIAAEKTWYEISDGEVMSLDALNKKMDCLFTEKMIGSLDGTLKKLYHEENGRLYIADYAGSDGGVLGVDTVHIAYVGNADENTLVLYMTAFGAGENWDLDHDLSENFTVVLKNTDSGLKIDVCDFAAYQYIEWCYAPKDDIFE